jgi:GTP cyclohydrolase II
MILVTSSKKKVIGLDGYGIKITKQEIIKWNSRSQLLIQSTTGMCPKI